MDPEKAIFGHFNFFGHFPIESPIEAEGTQNSRFPGSKCSTLTYLFSGSKMQPGTAMYVLNFYTLVFWIPLIIIQQYNDLDGSIIIQQYIMTWMGGSGKLQMAGNAPSFKIDHLL